MGFADPTSYRRLSEFLPRSLKSLTLTYSEHFDDHRPQWLEQHHDFEIEPEWCHSYYSHVEQLFADKVEHLPNLTKFEMHSFCPWWPCPCEGIFKTAETAGVELVVKRNEHRSRTLRWSCEMMACSSR